MKLNFINCEIHTMGNVKIKCFVGERSLWIRGRLAIHVSPLTCIRLVGCAYEVSVECVSFKNGPRAVRETLFAGASAMGESE